MKLFILANLLILLSGLLPLALRRYFSLMKSVAVVGIGMGCVAGMVAGFNLLLHPTGASLHLFWMNDLFSLTLRPDPLSAFFLLPIYVIGLAAVVFSFHYFENPGQKWRVAVGYTCFSILVVSMSLVVCAGDMLTFLLAWEFMTLSSFCLVIFNHHEESSRTAGRLYLGFSQAGVFVLFIAFGIIYSHTGSFSFANGLTGLPESVKTILFLLLLAGFGSKAGVFPLHIWLPHAHPAAPSHVSAVMSGVMIKMGIYGIVRFYALLQPVSVIPAKTVLVIGVISGVLGVVHAIAQHNLKRLLAYSSVENIGIILIGIGVGMLGAATGNDAMAVIGFTGGLLHVVNHALFKSLLFMGAGVIQHKTGTLQIEKLGGLMQRMPLSGSAFLAGSLAITGLPPFNGFVSELLIYIGAFKGTIAAMDIVLFSVLAIISLAMIGGLAAACFTKVIGIVFLGSPRTEQAQAAIEGKWATSSPMIVLAVFCLLIGLLPSGAVVLTAKAVSPLGLTPYPVGNITVLAGNITFGCLLVLGLIAVTTMVRRALRRGKEEFGPTWGCGFTRPTARIQYTGSSYARSLLEFYRPFAPVREKTTGIKTLFPGRTAYHSHVDDRAESSLDTFVFRPLFWLTHKLRWIQHGNIQLYIGYIMAALVILLLVKL